MLCLMSSHIGEAQTQVDEKHNVVKQYYVKNKTIMEFFFYAACNDDEHKCKRK